ncbi:MAG: VOC family protein [Phycisphaeraceae bacterium]|nr:VOC family protein [Phycisphaeraceae bacterium]MCB9847194.1 VOC family protein [Phycisphaeraceae bacterium]
MPTHHTINYLELPAADPGATKAFFSKVFNWSFTDFGPDYCAREGGEIDVGFFRIDDTNKASRQALGAALIVFYSSDIERTLRDVKAAGGRVIKPIFDFPGGRRFHFLEPSGNEFAVWSDPAD